MVGSTWVIWWKDAQGTASLSQIQERLLRGLRAQPKGRWTMDAKLYHSSYNFNPTRQQPTDHLMYLINRNTQQFYTMASQRAIVETTAEMESIISRLKNLWQLRQSARIEGYSYEGDDWVIRTGNLMVGTSYKGLVVEINYLPCSNPQETEGLMRELLLMVMPKDAQVDANLAVDYKRAGLDSKKMTDCHTAYQYVNLFTKNSLL